MRLDNYSNPIFNEQDLFDAFYQGFKPTSADTIIVDRSEATTQLENYLDFSFAQPISEDNNIQLKDFDSALQSNWNMPEEYKTLDIEDVIVSVCPAGNLQRVLDELKAFEERNMIDLLRWLKYFVDTCEKTGVVWGVGRGSSVASYVLFLLGVHSIDSVKYNLDWQEFLR
jgi:DNA polymerase III alpha subunit